MTTPTAQNTKAVSVKEVLAYLTSQFPACFSAAGEAKPLKVGIFQDLALRLEGNETVSKTQLRQALRVYTSSWRYLEAIKEGVARVDIDGNAGDVIDSAQAEHASKLLAESKAIAAEKRKAKIAEARAKNPAPVTDKPAFKKPVPKKATIAAKSAKVNKPQAPKVEKVDAAPAVLEKAVNVAVGNKVLIKLGQTPMPATVLEVHKDDVTVQLSSGMVVKARQDSLFLA